MKKIALLLFLLLATVPAFAQVSFSPVSIAFPHLDVGGDPAGLNYVTLIQAVNNNSATTNAHLVLFADNGSALSASFDGSAAQSSFDFSLESGVTRQIAISSSGAITSGWMQITYTPADAQTTVIIQYRAGTSVLSEVGVLSSGLTSGTDFSGETDTANNLNTGIAIVNPSSSSAAALVRLWDPATGNQLGSTTVPSEHWRSVAPLGSTTVPLSASAHSAQLCCPTDSR